MHFSGRRCCAAAAFGALLAWRPLPARAAEAAPAELVPVGTGAYQVRERGAVVATVPVSTPPLRRGTPMLRTEVVDGHRVAELRIPVRGTGRVELWLGELVGKGARVIWNGIAGPRDSDGETSLVVELGEDQIDEYQTSAQVSRCDGRPARLFPRAWDFAAGKFRPVVSPLPPAATQKLVARRGDPAVPSGRPVGGFRWTAASTTAGEGRDARGLTAPSGLNDDNPATVWAEGLGGDGRGEFLTARASAGTPRVLGLRIVPGDASSLAAFQARNRVRRFQLSLGPGPEQQFDVELADQPVATGADGWHQPYWIALPQPVATSCVGIVLTEVTHGREAAPPRSFGTTVVSEVEIFTELDLPDGARRLVADVARGGDCEGKVALLVSLGDAVVLPAAAMLEGAQPAGRACLVEALSRLPAAASNPPAIEALVGALKGASAREQQQITATVRRAPAPPVAALGALLADEKAAPEDRARAASVLGMLNDEAATRTLLGAAGRGPEGLRAAVVQALGTTTRLTPALLWPLLEPPPTPASADLLRVLPAALRRQPDEIARGLKVLRAALAPTAPFELRGRAVMALGELRSDEAVAALAQLRSTADEPVLRYLAARELQAAPGATATAALRAALQDSDPRVRETAALGLGEHKDLTAATDLIAGAKQEPWPVVRRAQLEALGRLCGAGAGDLMIRAVARDVDQVRRAALVSLARCRDPRGKTVLLRTLGQVNEAAGLRALAAGLLAELGDATAGPSLAAFLPRLVNESEADLAVEGVVVAALRALARIGGPAPVKAIAALATDRRHSFAAAAVDALGTLCDRDVGAATLRRLSSAAGTTDADAALARAARAAEARCTAPR